MDRQDDSGRGLLQWLLDFRNCAAELRIVAENMHEEPAALALAIAATFDRAAERVQTILVQSAEAA